MSKLEIQTLTGEPVKLKHITLQPVSQSFSWIQRTWGFVWNRPYALKVEEDGTTRQIPIRDVTQIAFFALWGLTVLFSLMTLWKTIKDWSSTND
jgi:hypothetical protein